MREHNQCALEKKKNKNNNNENKIKQQHTVTDRRYDFVFNGYWTNEWTNEQCSGANIQARTDIYSLPIVCACTCVREWWEQTIVISNPFQNQW